MPKLMTAPASMAVMAYLGPPSARMMDACVQLRFTNGSMISIDCTAVADKVAHAIRQRSELYWLVYNDPIGYADLILNGDPEQYLKDITKQD
jgi:hypothetical protein